jgi:hypothetical protein
MAIYRSVYTSFWQDAFIVELSPDEKYFYLYLMTNPKTNICGIYEFSIPIAVLETGFKKEKIEQLLKKFQEDYHKVLYSPTTNEIAIFNWSKYNESKSPSIKTAIDSGLSKVKNKSLIDYIHSVDTVSTECLHNPPYTVTVPVTVNSIVSLKDKEEKPSNIDYKQIADYWNEKMANTKIPKVRLPLTDLRIKHIKARVEQNGLETVYEMVDKVSNSNFLKGLDTNWVASFSFCFESPENFSKIIEGNYDNKEKPTKNGNALKDETVKKYGGTYL